MRTVWKFPLQASERQAIEMPHGAKLLTAGMDPTGQACVWAEVDSDAEREMRMVGVFGTGHPLPASSNFNPSYVGSFVMEPSFVWHVYEVAG